MKKKEKISVRPFDLSKTDYSDSDNYQVLWIKKGSAVVTIDLEEFEVRQNTICFLTPDRSVKVLLNSKSVGCVLRFSKLFFQDLTREDLNIKNAALVSVSGQIPKIILSPKIGDRVHEIAEMIDELCGSQIPNKETAVASLLKTLLIYCDSRCNIRINDESNHNNIRLVTTYKELVAKHFTHIHQVNEYARMMNISPKYLTQVVKDILGVTAKSVIVEQLMIRARHDLKFSDQSVKEIAFGLGFSEPFHFSNFFKREFGFSPTEFRHT